MQCLWTDQTSAIETQAQLKAGTGRPGPSKAPPPKPSHWSAPPPQPKRPPPPNSKEDSSSWSAQSGRLRQPPKRSPPPTSPHLRRPPAQLGHPPKRYQEPLWRWRRREPGRQRKRSASPGTTQTWPRIMMNRGSPADLRWAPVHGSPRAEDGATPIGVADVGVAGALAAAAPLLSSYRCIF